MNLDFVRTMGSMLTEAYQEQHMTTIVAIDRNGVIGNGTEMGWHNREDLAHFKAKTKGKVMVMGYTTYQSLPTSVTTDPERYCVVMTSKVDELKPTATVCYVGDLLQLYHKLNELNPTRRDDYIYVIGGAAIYQQLTGSCKYMLLTKIDTESNGDLRFEPDWSEWRVVSQWMGKAETGNPNIYQLLERDV